MASLTDLGDGRSPTGLHCPTCTCAPEAAKADIRCPDCGARWIDDDGAGHYGMRHADDCPQRCPHCGSEELEVDNHRDECPTIGTCAQSEPSLSRPWHLEGDWWDGDWRNYSAALRQHLTEHH